MGQSLLIDMNSGWYKHKTEVNDGLKTRNYIQCLGSLDALNALLPMEYRVSIDTEEYKEKLKASLVALCNFCTTEYPSPDEKDKTVKLPTQIERSKIQTLTITLSSFDQMVYGKKQDDFWQCEKCSNLNRFSQTRFKQTILKKPYYLQVVPEPPKRHLGIEDRNTFHNKFEAWARNFLSELNASAQRFRQEYRPKDGEEDAENEIAPDDDIDD